MTLAELLEEVAEETGYAPTTMTGETRRRLVRRINEWHRRLLATPGLTRFLRESRITLTTVAGTSTYGLPPSVGQIVSLTEGTNDVRLQQRSLSWIRTEDPGLTAEGVPEVYAPLGYSPVQTQPADASTLYVVSSDADDTTNVVTLRYLTASGVLTTATATLTGTSAVAIGSGVVEVVGFRVVPSCEGTVTLTEDSSGGTTLATIPPSTYEQRYLRVQLWPTPQAAVTYTVDVVRENQDLVVNEDEPLLPRDFHYLLRLGACADEMRTRDDTRYQVFRADMERGINDLKSWIWNNADYQPSGSGRGSFSRLGGWFPAGS